MEDPDLSPKEPPKRWLVGAAAAAVALLGVVAVLALTNRDNGDPGADRDAVAGVNEVEPADQPRDLDDVGELPALLESEDYVTDVLGTPVTFSVAEPVWLIQHETGLISLSTAADGFASPVASLVRPLDPGAGIDGQDVSLYLLSDPNLTSQLAGAGERDGNETSAFITFVEQNDTTAQCQIGAECVPLFLNPDVGLRAGGTTNIEIVEQGDEAPLYAISWSAPTTSDVAGLAQVGATLELGETASAPNR